MKLKLTNNFAKPTLTALAVASCLCLASVAHAGFINGGFEDGTFNGWTLKYGTNDGYTPGSNPLNSVTWGGSAPTPVIVDKSTDTDAYVPGFASTFVGNKQAKINDIDGDNHVTQLSQTGTINASDLNGGTTASVYIDWISVMDNPGHDDGENPWFNIDITKNGVSVYDVTHTSTDTGWTKTGTYGSDDVFEGAGQAVLGGLNVGDKIDVLMTVADCSLGAHGAYAYLDGIGTAPPTPPTPTPTPTPTPPNCVPEASSTLALLSLGFVCLGVMRRRLF